MQTLDDARKHCRSVGKGIEMVVADGKDLGAHFEGTQLLQFKVEKVGNAVKVVGGELGGDAPPRCSLRVPESPIPSRISRRNTAEKSAK